MFKTIEEMQESIERVFAHLMKQRRDFCFYVEDETFFVVEVEEKKTKKFTRSRKDLEDATLAMMYREIMLLLCRGAEKKGDGDVDAPLLKVKFIFKNNGGKNEKL